MKVLFIFILSNLFLIGCMYFVAWGNPITIFSEMTPDERFGVASLFVVWNSLTSIFAAVATSD